MIKKNIIPVQLSQELLNAIDVQVSQARAAMPVATITRSAMMRELLRLGLERRAQLQDYSRDEQRQAQAREQRQAASAG